MNIHLYVGHLSIKHGIADRTSPRVRLIGECRAILFSQQLAEGHHDAALLCLFYSSEVATAGGCQFSLPLAGIAGPNFVLAAKNVWLQKFHGRRTTFFGRAGIVRTVQLLSQR